MILNIGAGIKGGSGDKFPTQNNLWALPPHRPHFTTEVASPYKYINTVTHSYVYYLRFVTSYLHLNPISVETMFALLYYHSTYLFRNRVHEIEHTVT